MAVVEGRLQIRDWTDKDGNKQRSAEVVVDNIYFGGSKAKDGGSDGMGYSVRKPDSGYGNSYSVASGAYEEIGDDGKLPF